MSGPIWNRKRILLNIVGSVIALPALGEIAIAKKYHLALTWMVLPIFFYFQTYSDPISNIAIMIAMAIMFPMAVLYPFVGDYAQLIRRDRLMRGVCALGTALVIVGWYLVFFSTITGEDNRPGTLDGLRLPAWSS